MWARLLKHGSTHLKCMQSLIMLSWEPPLPPCRIIFPQEKISVRIKICSQFITKGHPYGRLSSSGPPSIPRVPCHRACKAHWDVTGPCESGPKTSQEAAGTLRSSRGSRSPAAILTMWGDSRLMLITVRLILLSSRSIICCTCSAVGPCGANTGMGAPSSASALPGTEECSL